MREKEDEEDRENPSEVDIKGKRVKQGEGATERLWRYIRGLMPDVTSLRFFRNFGGCYIQIQIKKPIVKILVYRATFNLMTIHWHYYCFKVVLVALPCQI